VWYAGEVTHLCDSFVKIFKRKRLLGEPGCRWKYIKVDSKWDVRVCSGFMGFGGRFL
jgi:hypothetical protein